MEHMPGPWSRGSWPETVRHWGSWDGVAAALGSFRSVIAPYLSSGLCSNLSLPHRSHVDHEKAVLSSMPITVPRSKQKKNHGLRGSVCTPNFSLLLRTQMTIWSASDFFSHLWVYTNAPKIFVISIYCIKKWQQNVLKLVHIITKCIHFS